MITIQVKGLEKTRRYFNRIAKRVPHLTRRMSKEIAKKIQKSAKLRAPRATGQLAESIRIRSIENGFAVRVESPYGVYQEEGFIPHRIKGDTPSRTGYRFTDWLRAKGSDIPEERALSMWFWVSKSKPFMKPAFQKTMDEMPHILRRYGRKIIKK